MAGIYIHIPFCKQACYYCDFHFSTNLSYQEEMVDTLCRELAMRSDYLSEPVETLYFGGGTPSLLSFEQLRQLVGAVRKHFRLLPEAEVTLEANPDDLTPEKLEQCYKAGINRLSIGIQSFHPPHLHYLNRLHTAEQALTCVQRAKATGFENITIDLIYAIPAKDHSVWKSDLENALSLDVDHISAYCLTIEEKTVFGNWQKKGIIQPIDDEYAADHFDMLVSTLKQAGYEQYEVSNFARNKRYSRHNTAYWQDKPYLGIGPGSHSYDRATRQFTLSSNPQYIRGMGKGSLPARKEVLSPIDKCNELLLTGLRTKWGCDLRKLEAQGVYLKTSKQSELEECQARGWLLDEGNVLRLTRAGLLQADYITALLFVE